MPRRQRWGILFVAVLFLMAILPSPLVAELMQLFLDRTQGHWLKVSIYDFQTLITGGLAIVAAVWTVLTMESTDARSERRHRELVSLQLRSDALRVERMLFPFLNELIDRNCSMKQFDPQTIESRFGQAELTKALYGQVNEVIGVGKVLQSEAYKNAEDLFGGILTHHLKALKIDLVRLQHSAGQVASIAKEWRKSANEPDEMDIADRDAAVATFQKQHPEVIFTFDVVLIELKNLGKKYEVN